MPNSNPASTKPFSAVTPQDPEARLRQLEERFRLFMENVKEYAIFMLDVEGRVVDWNLGAEHVLGYGDEILGQPFAIFFPSDDRAAGVPERELKAAAERGQASDDRWHVRKDGSYFWALGITTAMRDEAGVLKGFAKVLRDSTDRKRFEEQLRERNQALEEADRRKDEFLAVLGHELRNPLAPVFNALAILRQPEAPKDAHQHAREVIDRQARALARLIDDLLDVTRISTGKVQLRLSRVDLSRIVEDAVQTAKPFIESKFHKLQVSIPPEPIYVEADSTRIEQVVVNLLNNAAKYTDANGTIDVRVDRSGGRALVSVSDNGIGIAPALLPQIFDLFAQGEQSLDRSHGGLGIGLTLARKIVELHHGSITAKSAGEGTGSDFVVCLPILQEDRKSVDPHSKTQAAQPAARPLCVVVVDDNMDAAETLSVVLRLSGHDVHAAHSGSAALELVQERRPDVVLLDIGLPGLNGYQVAEFLTHSQGLKKPTLIAMTGYGHDEARARSLRAGFSHHIVKPVVPTDLIRLLDEVAALRK